MKWSLSVVSDSLWSHRLYSAWNSPGQNTGGGGLFLLQAIFPTQGSNPGLQHCRQILYRLNHQGSPRILVWVAYPISRGSSNSGIWRLRLYKWILYLLSYEESQIKFFFIDILVLQPEIEPMLPSVEAQSLNHCTCWEVLEVPLSILCFGCLPQLTLLPPGSHRNRWPGEHILP